MRSIIDRIPVCPHGTKDSIDVSLILALERLETEMKGELEFSSGYRCKECNARAGGVKNSAHLRGMAVDILIDNSRERYATVYNAFLINFRRVGVGKNIVHLDVDTSLPPDVLWLY